MTVSHPSIYCCHGSENHKTHYVHCLDNITRIKPKFSIDSTKKLNFSVDSTVTGIKLNFSVDIHMTGVIFNFSIDELQGL